MNFTRRSWLKGAAAGAVGLGAAKAGFEKLIPAVVSPDNTVPGISTWYSTTCRECPAGCGMRVRVRENRPVKCEGNPDHPISRGKLCALGQAALQGLYHPDRLSGPAVRAEDGSWRGITWDAALSQAAEALTSVSGADRVAVITDLQTTTLAEVITRFLEGFQSRLYLRYEPINYESLKRATAAVYEMDVVPAITLEGCDLIISLGADVLDRWLSPVQFSQEWGRACSEGKRPKLFYFGPRLSQTAAMADERYLVAPGHEALAGYDVLRALAVRKELFVGFGSDPLRGFAPSVAAAPGGLPDEVIDSLADALEAAERPVVLGGDEEAALAAMMLNRLVGSPCVWPDAPHALSHATSVRDMRALIREMNEGRVEVLIIAGANPAYSLPPGLGFAAATERVPHVISLSHTFDETAGRATLCMPMSHPLESWGDYEPQPGVWSLQQPVIGRFLDTLPLGDILLQLAAAAGKPLWFDAPDDGTDFGHLVRSRIPPSTEGVARHLSMFPSDELLRVNTEGWFGVPRETQVRQALQAGGRFREPWGATAVWPPMPLVVPVELGGAIPGDGPVLVTLPSQRLFDGRGANKAWLQELPDPMTKLVWGSWIELGPETAAAQGIATGDLVTVTSEAGSVEAPAYVWEGVAEGAVVLQLGGGHTAYGENADGVGVNAFSLLSADATYVKVTLSRSGSGDGLGLVSPQGGDEQYNRPIALIASETELERQESEIALPLPEGYLFPDHDIYPAHEHVDHRWAMTVDLGKCTGCAACVVACYAENNIATVGKEQVARGREMAWLRIDRYFDWGSKAPVRFLPMMCQQCDSAPCEPVCPVYATVHSEDGLNAQVYNRCVGTRYCSNNCPYKARRFNWFDYEWPEPLNYQLNPDVTVRERGVMEKCSFCVQRIREVTQRAKAESRTVKDGEIQPACVQTCPTGALVFGDLMDPGSQVSKAIRSDPRAYQLLHELNTKPAVIYLKRVVHAV